MRKVVFISISVVAVLIITIALFGSCSGDGSDISRRNSKTEVIASVDNIVLTRKQLAHDTPRGLSGDDSVTFTRMYIDNWVIKQLKILRAKEVLTSSQSDIERLVEDYRQSLIIRNLDQYYIDNSIDLEISDKQIIAHYRANSASFKLDHNKVRGVIVKVPKNFRNTSSLNTALKSASKGDITEITAFAEKHNLQLTDMSGEWVRYADFLSHLPTERSSSYNHLLSKRGTQQMSGDNATFYFVLIDVAHKGNTAPIECVREDIKRMLYADRCQNIIKNYEDDLLHNAASKGRVHIADTTLMRNMQHTPKPQHEEPTLRDIPDSIEEESPIL